MEQNQDTPEIEYAVIGFYEDNNQIFCHHVTADSAMNAFAQVAASSADGMQGDPVFVAALPVADTGRLEYPGEGLVYEGIVRKQGEVFPLHHARAREEEGRNVAPSSANEAAKRTVFIEAYACDSYGDGPKFAKLEVTPGFCDRLASLQQLCVDRNLSELRVYEGPDVWGPGNIEDELRLSDAELVVTKTSFWFTDHPKHTDYSIETRAQGIQAFIESASAKSDEPLFLGEDIEALKERVDEDEASATLHP